METYLRILEQSAEKFCHSDTYGRKREQAKLIPALNNLSYLARTKILQWSRKWLLIKGSAKFLENPNK